MSTVLPLPECGCQIEPLSYTDTIFIIAFQSSEWSWNSLRDTNCCPKFSCRIAPALFQGVSFTFQAVDTCSALLRVAAESQVNGGLIDCSVYEELQYSFDCRLVNYVTIHPHTTSARLLPVYEIRGAKVPEPQLRCVWSAGGVVVRRGVWCSSERRLPRVTIPD